MLSTVLDIVFPQKVLHPHIPIDPYTETQVELSARGIGSLDLLLSACAYERREVQHSLHLWKYKKRTVLTTHLASAVTKVCLPYIHPDTVLVPVPLFFTRYLSRGFNQSTLLAMHIARVTGLPVRNILVRTKDTGHQAWRGRYERMEYMRDAFSVRAFRTVPKHVVLIDDIATTGATLDSCASVLKDAGCKRVDAWVVARA